MHYTGSSPETGGLAAYTHQSARSPDDYAANARAGLNGNRDPLELTDNRHGRILPLRYCNLESEKKLREFVLTCLVNHFEIDTEVRGEPCPGSGLKKYLQIDAVARPRNPAPWKDADPVFGIEFKRTADGDHLSRYSRWLKQAFDYSHARWTSRTLLPEPRNLSIFTCPSVAEECAYLREPKDGYLWPRMLGPYAIGELCLTHPAGFMLRMSGEAVWTESCGVARPARSLIPKTGSQ